VRMQRWLLVPVIWVLALLVFDASDRLPSIDDVFMAVADTAQATVRGQCDYYLAYSTRNGGMPPLVRFCREHQNPPATAIGAVQQVYQPIPHGSGGAALLGACTGSQASPTVLIGRVEDGMHCMAVDIGHGYQRWVLVIPQPAPAPCSTDACLNIRRADKAGPAQRGQTVVAER
jgi:hypothetical protein